MSELVKIESRVVCREISDNDLRSSVIKLFGELYVGLRWAVPTASELVVMSDLLIKDYLRQHFTTFTIEEIRRVCKDGIGGVYGEFAGISPAVISKWLHAYMGSAERVEFNKKLMAQSKPQPKELTDEEKEKINLNGVVRCWMDFKEKGVVYDFGNATYNFLDNKGLIPFTKERKWEIYKEVKERLIQQSKEKRAKAKDVLMKKNMDELIYALTSETGNEKANLIFESRREALKIYFNDLLEMGEDLETILKDK